MSTQVVTVSVPPNLLHLASKVAGQAGASANKLIETALKIYQGIPRDEAIAQMSEAPSNRTDLKQGGKKSAKVDTKWLEGIEGLSRANRVGLLMLVYDMTRDEADEFEMNSPWHLKVGRPRKQETKSVA